MRLGLPRNATTNSPRRNGAEPSTARPTSWLKIRSRTDRLPPFLDKMQEWMDGGARLGWAIDPHNSHVYVYRLGQAGPELLEDPGDFVR